MEKDVLSSILQVGKGDRESSSKPFLIQELFINCLIIYLLFEKGKLTNIYVLDSSYYVYPQGFARD